MESKRVLSNVLLLVIFCFIPCHSYSVNKTDQERGSIDQGSLKARYTPELARLIAEEEATWHWMPWHHVRTVLVDDTYDAANCSDDGGGDFPDDLFTDEQLRQGAIILHFIGMIYGFSLLAVLCDDYFIPAVECICEDLGISKDVAAATFMASATSCPELFVNVMATFLTESDLGIGTIVGSALFNTLGVAAVGSFAAIYPIAIQRWPVTRDSVIYIFNVIVLVVVIWDDRIVWWETVILLVLYFSYFILMFNSKRMYECVDNCCCSKHAKEDAIAENGSEIDAGLDNPGFQLSENARDVKAIETGGIEKTLPEVNEDDDDDENQSPMGLCSFPKSGSIWEKFKYLYFWPITLILTCTIPRPRLFHYMYPLTFLMCIIMIGLNSYFVSWMITTIGSTLSIPDSIMGMTFLAFGGCLPETFSIYVVAKKGKGDMGVSNSLGANSLAILFSLGLPWFIKSMILRSQGEEGYIEIQSGGMNYIIISIILAVIVLYLILAISKFRLMKKTGAAAIIAYLIFAVFAILMEAGIIFEFNPPAC